MFILFLFSAFPIRGEPVKIDGYMGDGTITKIGSSTFPGFEIEFTRFNISKHHRERYKLEGLPKGRVDNSYYISLRAYEKYELDIAKTDIAKMGFLDGKINLKITDDKGEILFEKRSKISDLIRTSRDGKANDFYYMDKETFSGFKSTALDSQPLHVEFEYVPALSKNKKNMDDTSSTPSSNNSKVSSCGEQSSVSTSDIYKMGPDYIGKCYFCGLSGKIVDQFPRQGYGNKREREKQVVNWA